MARKPETDRPQVDMHGQFHGLRDRGHADSSRRSSTSEVGNGSACPDPVGGASDPDGLLRRLAARIWSAPPGLTPALALEWRLVAVRWGGIAAVGPAVLLARMDRAHSLPALAVLGLAAVYNLFAAAALRRRPALLSNGYITSACDALLNVLMIVAVGGFDSPFYYLLFTVTVSAAMRFGFGPAIASVCLYVGLDSFSGYHNGHMAWAAFLCRSGFLIITALLAGYLSSQAHRAQEAVAERLRQAQLLDAVCSRFGGYLEMGHLRALIAEASCLLLGGTAAIVAVEEDVSCSVWARQLLAPEDLERLQRLVFGADLSASSPLILEDRARIAIIAVAVRAQDKPLARVGVMLDIDPCDLDGDIVRRFAERAALAVENASLYRVRMLAEQALRRANRALAALEACHRAYARATDEDGLLRTACQALIDVGGYRMAWVGVPEHNPTKTVRPLTIVGTDEGYLNDVSITWDETLFGGGPVGTAIRTGQPAVVQDLIIDSAVEPWREEMARRGFASLISLPLIIEAKIYAALTIYAGEPDAFDAEETRLLTELAGELVYGIVALRAHLGRRRAEIALQASEARYRRIVETANEGIWLGDAGAVTTFVNARLAEMLGYGAEEMLGMSLFDFVDERAHPLLERELAHQTEVSSPIPGEPAQSHAAGTSRLRSSGSAVSTDELHAGDGSVSWGQLELQLRRKDGGDLWVHISATAIVGEQGSRSGGLAMITDISQRKREEQFLDQARRAAEEFARLQDDFVASVGHELRTPLTAILGYAELLQARWQMLDDARRADHLRRIVLAANRQKRVVHDLLTLSTIEGGVMAPPRCEHMELSSLLQQACDEVGSSYRNLRFDLPDADATVLFADPDHAVQILVNLLDNAAKYSPPGSPIAVTCATESGLGVVRVRDCGSGIPDEGRTRLFTRFGRIPDSRIREGRVGTGLGLYLSRNLAQAMGGSVDLESTGPCGSVFRLCLPMGASPQSLLSA